MVNMAWNTPAGTPTDAFTITMNKTEGILRRERIADKLKTPPESGGRKEAVLV